MIQHDLLLRLNSEASNRLLLFQFRLELLLMRLIQLLLQDR